MVEVKGNTLFSILASIGTSVGSSPVDEEALRAKMHLTDVCRYLCWLYNAEVHLNESNPKSVLYYQTKAPRYNLATNVSFLPKFPIHVQNTRDQSTYALSQWETSLQCNDVYHWLGANIDWFLTYIFLNCGRQCTLRQYHACMNHITAL